MDATTTGKALLEKVAAIKGRTDKEILREKNRATVAGGVVGGLMGMYCGYTRQSNVLITGAVGAIIGACMIRLTLLSK